MGSGRNLLAAAACALFIAAAPREAGAGGPLSPRRYDVERISAREAVDAARTGAPFDLRFFGASHRVILEPSSLRSERMTALAHDAGEARAVYAGDEKTFKGHLADEPGSIVRLSQTRGGLRGFIKSASGWTFFEPLGTASAWLGAEPAGGTDHKVFTEGDIDPDWLGTCAEPLHLDGEASSGDAAPVPHEARATTAEAGLRVFEMAVDADVEFFQAYGSDTQAEIESILNMVDGIYEVELGISIEVVYVNVWESEPDPYTSTDSASLLNELRTHWNASNGSVARDGVHLFTGRDLDGSTVGIAYVGVVCSTSVAYSLSQDVSSDVLMPLLVAHEVGHNLGANHDPTGSNPRYIMYPSLGFSNLDQFSPTSKTDISNYVSGTSCLAFEGGGSNVSNPPPSTGGHHGGGGGPVDPVVALILAAGAVAEARRRARRPRDA